MNKKLKLFVIALCYVPLAFAQTGQTEGQNANETNESAFTFTEAQLGEDDDMSQNVTIVSSNNNIYASEVGYLFSPARFRYRAFNQKYNDVFINGVAANDLESGQFRFSLVGRMQGYALDITDQCMHHEIYLSDNRKVAPEKLKTVIRHPIRKA